MKPDKREICPLCKRPKRKTCDGAGWLDAIGPCSDGSYITSRPCPNKRTSWLLNADDEGTK